MCAGEGRRRCVLQGGVEAEGECSEGEGHLKWKRGWYMYMLGRGGRGR